MKIEQFGIFWGNISDIEVADPTQAAKRSIKIVLGPSPWLRGHRHLTDN